MPRLVGLDRNFSSLCLSTCPVCEQHLYFLKVLKVQIYLKKKIEV